MATNERFDELVTGWLAETAQPHLPDRVLATTFETTRKTRQHLGWRATLRRILGNRPVLALGGAAIAVMTIAVALGVYLDRPAVGGPTPSDDPRSSFLGTWYSTSDADGGTQAMTVRAAADGGVEIVVTDDVASVCQGTPSTMTGTGSVAGNKLVIPAPTYTCDDGSEPQTLSGPPLAEALRNLTYVRDPAANVLTVGAASESVWTRRVGAAPSTGPSPSPSGTATDAFPDLTSTFVSPINGYSFKYIDRGGLVPAAERWEPDYQAPIGDVELRAAGAPYLVQFDVVETGLGAVFLSASTAIPRGVATDAWVDAAVAKYLPNGCSMPRSQQAEIVIDGQPGRISECPNNVVATVIAGGRLYLFILAHDRPDARAVFDAFAATIDLTPERADDFDEIGAQSDPNLATTFVSPTNGFSFKYFDRGGLEPAKALWDPVAQPLPDDAFDLVNTGFAAAFLGASTVIPDGVSLDAWVDQYVSPGGCGVPRGQQAEITIDGQSGRISECPRKVEATVVAGGRLYRFVLSHKDRADARAFFDAFAATIELTPETAAVPGSVDGPEGMSVETLAITVQAPEDRFEEVVAETASIIESIESHPGGGSTSPSRAP